MSIHCKLLTSVSAAWRESNTEENFQTTKTGGQTSHWAWYTVMCAVRWMQTPSAGEYCLAFTDDKTRYVWIYILKHKDEVSPCFLEWKTLVEKSLKQKVKALRTDNGDGFESVQTFIVRKAWNCIRWMLRLVSWMANWKKKCTWNSHTVLSPGAENT